MGVIDDCWSAYRETCPCLHQSMSFRRFTRIGLGILLLLAVPLQSAGMFTSHWVYNETCSNIGLVYTECGNSTSGSEALNTTAFGLQVVSYITLLATVLFFISMCCCFHRQCQKYGDDKSAIAKFCFPCFLPTASFFAGFFNFVSCMVVSRLSLGESYEFGYSYYLCLTTGAVTASVSLLFVIGYCVHTNAKSCVCRCHMHMEEPKCLFIDNFFKEVLMGAVYIIYIIKDVCSMEGNFRHIFIEILFIESFIAAEIYLLLNIGFTLFSKGCCNKVVAVAQTSLSLRCLECIDVGKTDIGLNISSFIYMVFDINVVTDIVISVDKGRWQNVRDEKGANDHSSSSNNRLDEISKS
ncbi:uncharacterized protein LOC128549336 [Mercenaria mercenaria]|uniref:uncharacterized protein LOC128549336 n=1 Tax=Mercenaria mercenaria TaxID=6596 RepID=UPI00234E56C9|nr:uncharacterized protein LOC128549336 [Mercenaria mercenaria]